MPAAEFPEDILAAVQKVANGELDVATAILAERNRCAEISLHAARIVVGGKIGSAHGEEGQRIMAATGGWIHAEIVAGQRSAIRAQTAAIIERAMSGAKVQ